MSDFGDVRDDLVFKDGAAHCPYNDCDDWWPAGMEYLFLNHVEEHKDDDE